MDNEINYSGYNNPPSLYSSNNNASGNYGATNNPEPLYSSDKNLPAPKLVIGNGVNLQPSYSNGGVADLGWDLMKKQPEIKTVRIEIEPGQEVNAQRWIKEAVKDNGYKVIATYHDSKHLASDDDVDLLNAANWWINHYQELSNSGPFILNLMNEWGNHEITTYDFANAYNKAIAMVRSVYSGPIIIDIPGYGQETQTATEAVKGTAGIKINDTNIILSAHIYPCGWNYRKKRGLEPADINELTSTGLSCIIGEFGSKCDPKNSISTPNWIEIVNYANKVKGWPILGWAWGGDATLGLGNLFNMNMIDSANNNMKNKSQFEPFVAGTPYNKYVLTDYFTKIIKPLLLSI